MLNFLKSKEFWFTTVFLGFMFSFHLGGDLANIVQDFGLYGWSYVIYKMEKHHTLVRSILSEEGDNNEKDNSEI